MSIALIHRFLGESLVTLAVLGLIAALLARDPNGGARRLTLVALRLFIGLLSLQWLLGVINYFTIPAAVRPSLAHPLLMTLVVAASHMLGGKARQEPTAAQAMSAAVFAGSAVLMWLGMRLV